MPPRLQYHPGAYGIPNKTFIKNGSYVTKTVPPEFNLLTVSGTGYFLPNQDPQRLTKSMKSAAALGDTSDPDSLDEIVDVHHIDASLLTEQMVAFVLRRMFDFAGHAQKWAYFVAPLLFVNDTEDELAGSWYRPLRIGDIVRVAGQKAMVLSCNPAYEHDAVQWANMETLFVA